MNKIIKTTAHIERNNQISYVRTCREFRIVKIQANTVVSLLTDIIPISQVSPSSGNNTIVAFIKYLQCHKTQQKQLTIFTVIVSDY